MELSLKCTSYGWGNSKIKLEEISKLKHLTFKLELAIIDVYDNHGNTIQNNQYINTLDDNLIFQPTPYLLQQYIWKVKDKELLQQMKEAKNTQYFEGDAFGDDIFKWKLCFYPNGKNRRTKGESILYLHLLKLPKNVSGISIYFELFVKETGTQWSYCTHLRENKLCEGWETCRIKFKDIQNTKKLTFTAIISLIDVYDLNSNLVTHKFIKS